MEGLRDGDFTGSFVRGRRPNFLVELGSCLFVVGGGGGKKSS
jgi:hypothetical protein